MCHVLISDFYIHKTCRHHIFFNVMAILPRLFSKLKSILSFTSIVLLYVGIFYPSGEPFSPNLLCTSANAVDYHVTTSDRRECSDLIILCDRHEIAIFAALIATEPATTSTREYFSE
jgi:hypothetical protein